jgi:type II secretory pathway component PulC
MNMNIPQYLLKSVNLLNLGLLAIALAGIACTVVPMTDISVNLTPPPPAESNPGQTAQTAPGNHAPAYTDYALISEQNLFHPMRMNPPSSAQALPRPEVILYGTLITDDMRIAYLEDKKSPRTSPGRGKRQIALKKGESLSGYVLTAVEKDRVELAKGGDKIVIYLSDQNKARSDETTRSASPPASPQPTVQPRVAPPGPQPAVQPRVTPTAPMPAVQQRIMPSGPQSAVPTRATPAMPTPSPAPR